jgi:hypothetical protein
MFVWVVACLSEKRDEVLQLLDLVQIMDKSFGNLLNKEGSIRDFKLNLLLYFLVLLVGMIHLFSCDSFRHLTCALQSGCVANEGRGALNTLL